jgi:hypothetical protein
MANQTSEPQLRAPAMVQERADNFGKDNPRYRCLPDGPTNADGAGVMRRILQTPAMIAILYDDLTYRQIFMDGRALETNPSPSWMGYSVGRWDGDTLVVDSVGFNDRTWLASNFPHTEALRMTERYRRTDFGHLEIESYAPGPRGILPVLDLPCDRTVCRRYRNDRCSMRPR